jgi:hypothetical protein
MEYLMTYGWAILIIAVVLGVLFQMGIFNGSALTPKAAPGSCEVLRLAGQVSLEGECQGQLPQYVAWYDGAGFLDFPLSLYVQYQQITISIWVLSSTPASNRYGILGSFDSSTGQCVPVDFIQPGPGGTAMDLFVSNSVNGPIAAATSYTGATAEAWNHFVGTYNGVYGTMYVNGKAEGYSPQTSGTLADYPLTWLGAPLCGSYNFEGGLSNLQIYNTSLSSSEITTLYDEGIGGAPVKVQNLVLWYPLNGNGNDYGGNNYGSLTVSGGVVAYNGSWQGAYTPP